MKKSKCILAAVLIIGLGLIRSGISAAASPETKAHGPRLLSLSYGMAAFFPKPGLYSRRELNPYPALDGPARFQGMIMQGALGRHVLLALKGYGSLKENTTRTGYTNWGGGLTAVGIEFRQTFSEMLFIGGNGWLGGGRFNLSASSLRNDNKINIFTNAFFVEYQLTIGVVFRRRIVLSSFGSFMLPLPGSTVVDGNIALSSAFPRGLFVGAALGYQFRFLN
ncbi:MAG: hypothetical protein JXX14_17120 [Deltaproteobacteria bacterium]|nr:hypothetical protein [Deltaproteobacteria bacterium]